MFKKLICTLLCVVMLVSLCACSKAPVIVSYKDLSLDSSMYALHLAIEKKAIEEYFYYYYGVDISAMPEFWDEQYDEDNTWAEYIEAEFCNMLIAIEFCEEHNIKLTDEKIKKEIDELVQSYVDQAGGEDLLNIALGKYGADYDMLVEYLTNYQCITLMQDYLVSDGTLAVSDAEVAEYLEDFMNFDYVLFEAVDKDGKGKIDEDITDEDAEAYFNSDYVTVKHILYKTQGLSEDDAAAKKKKAEDALAAIQSGEASFDDYKSDNEDSNLQYTFTYGTMVSEFETAAYEMEIGEYRLVETAYGFHLMEKLELDTEEFDDMKSAVKTAITSQRIKGEAQKYYEKVVNGEATFGETEGATFGEGMVVQNGDTSVGEDLYKLLEETELGEYCFYSYGTYGYYVFKRVEFEADDIEKYKESVSGILVADKFTDYMLELAKSVEVNTVEMEKFDIKTVRSFSF